MHMEIYTTSNVTLQDEQHTFYGNSKLHGAKLSLVQKNSFLLTASSLASRYTVVQYTPKQAAVNVSLV